MSKTARRRIDVDRALFEEWESATDDYEDLARNHPDGEVNEAAQSVAEISVKILLAFRGRE